MSKATIPLTLLLPEAVALGRFVTNTSSPAEEFFDSEVLSENTKRVLVTQKNNFREVLQNSSSSSFESTLTKLISAHSSFESLDHIQLEGLVNKTYQLQNSTDTFENACGDPAARKWLTKMLKRGRSINMVVGFETIFDAQVSINNSQKHETGGAVTVPVSQALTTAVAVPIPLTDMLDVSAKGSTSKGSQVEASFVAPGEMIFAVQYRKLKFSWFSSKNTDNATLDKSRWKVNMGVRSAAKVDEDDIIEASLEDPSDTEGEQSEGYVYNG